MSGNQKGFVIEPNHSDRGSHVPAPIGAVRPSRRLASLRGKKDWWSRVRGIAASVPRMRDHPQKRIRLCVSATLREKGSRIGHSNTGSGRIFTANGREPTRMTDRPNWGGEGFR